MRKSKFNDEQIVAILAWHSPAFTDTHYSSDRRVSWQSDSSHASSSSRF
jgi:hypothetical protein